MQAARDAPGAGVELVLVERDQRLYADLSQVATEYEQQGVQVITRLGDVQDHLAEVVERAAGVPLFLFLDPCGAQLPYTRLVSLLAKERPAAKWPPTEVLLNFSADLTRRAGGQLRSGVPGDPLAVTVIRSASAEDVHDSWPHGSWSATRTISHSCRSRRWTPKSKLPTRSDQVRPGATTAHTCLTTTAGTAWSWVTRLLLVMPAPRHLINFFDSWCYVGPRSDVSYREAASLSTARAMARLLAHRVGMVRQ